MGILVPWLLILFVMTLVIQEDLSLPGTRSWSRIMPPFSAETWRQQFLQGELVPFSGKWKSEIIISMSLVLTVSG